MFLPHSNGIFRSYKNPRLTASRGLTNVDGK